jgi:tetratricopeptide (TPR) repeat protein
VRTIPSDLIGDCYDSFKFKIIDPDKGKMTRAMLNFVVIRDRLESEGKYDFLLTLYNEILHIAQVRGDVRNESRFLKNIAGIFFSFGRYQESLEYYDEAAKLCGKFIDSEIKYDLGWGYGNAEKLIENLKRLDSNDEIIHQSRIDKLRKMKLN